MKLDDGDSLDASLADLVRTAEGLLDGCSEHGLGGWAGAAAVNRAVEVIESGEKVTYIVDIPELGDDFSVTFHSSEMVIAAGNIELRQHLPCEVDRGSVSHEYRNGTLSIVVLKPS